MTKFSFIVSTFILFLMMTACNSDRNAGKGETQDALETIFARKSVRKYLPNPVEQEKTELLLKAGMAAPTGKNTQPWEFVVVTDRAALDSMAAALPYAKMLKEAPMAIVVCGDVTKSSYWYIDCAAAAENILLYPAFLRFKPLYQFLHFKALACVRTVFGGFFGKLAGAT